MKPLKKSYEASEENVLVKFGNKIVKCANLKKSGIQVQSKILVANNDVWNEVDIIGLGADKTKGFKGLENSNLYNFKNLVEQTSIPLKHLGLDFESDEPKSYELTHDDFMRLDKSYGFSYVYIEKLVAYFRESKQKTGEFNVVQTLKYLKQKGRTIQEYIQHQKDQAKEIINDSNKILKMEENETLQSERINFLQSLGFQWEEHNGAYICRYGAEGSPASFSVSIKSIEEDTEEDWNKTVERIEFSVPSAGATTYDLPKENHSVTDMSTASETPAPAENKPETLPAVPVNEEKKPVSLTVIGSLTPERIKEFASMKVNQEQIVKDNPFLKPTDAATLKKAKVHAAALLKASTAIDGKTGIKAAKNKYLKQLNTVLDTFLDSMTGLTRTAYDKQKLANDAFESAEALRIQNEKKAALEKTNARTKQLFDVPMVFDGANYNIGTLYILPSQIVSATDEEFSALVAQAKGIKAGLDAAEEANKGKDKLIEELMARLAKLEGKETPAAAPVETVTITKPTNTGPTSGTTTNYTTSPTTSAAPPTTAPVAKTIVAGAGAPASSELVYTAPDDNNTVLLAFDLENLEHVEKQAFLKCRSYYIKGLQDSGKAIENIFSNADKDKKAPLLKELAVILKNS